ncbi:MAG TPA: hypothetical protein VL688_05130 [Verrucomicrobiae bacterium]|jgi:hypothetical protein|nr:hypothetical protein [Verrucomicrobiae bacterium]
MKKSVFILTGILGVLAKAPFAMACAVCFGDPSSPSSKAVKAGILLLLGVTGTVLSGIGALIFTWSRRAKLLETGSEPPLPPA